MVRGRNGRASYEAAVLLKKATRARVSDSIVKPCLKRDDRLLPGSSEEVMMLSASSSQSMNIGGGGGGGGMGF